MSKPVFLILGIITNTYFESLTDQEIILSRPQDHSEKGFISCDFGAKQDVVASGQD